MKILGVVTYYDSNKGCAFVRPLMEAAGETPVIVEGEAASSDENDSGDGRICGEYFFHRSQLPDGRYRGVSVGSLVEFEPGEKGLVKAVNLHD